MLKNVIFPKWNDSRIIIILFFMVYVTYALVSPWFGRTWQQLVVIQSTCIILDFVIAKIRTGKWIFPLSGIIAASGMFLVLDAYGIWPYFAVGLMAMLSKHLLRINNRHIFNPNNFGVMMLISGFPTFATLTAARWGGHFLWVFII